MNVFREENKSETKTWKKNKNQQNGAKFRHLKDPSFILCWNTKAYRIIQERRSLSLNSIRLYT